MGLRTTAGLNRGLKSAEAKTLHASRLNIGPRLILGFVFIILSMLVADAVILWQFHLVRAQAERLNGIDQKLVAVLRVHTSLLAFHDRLEELADTQDLRRLVIEGGPLRTAVLEDTRRAMSALSLLPSDLQRDPTIVPTLHAVQSALAWQLEDITTLATSGDWRAVHLRLENQVRPLESLTSELVEKVDHEAGEEQAQTVRDITRVQRLIFVIVPLTAVFTLLIAATLGLAITRSITQPLARLVEGSKALARGEFQHQVSVTGRDELAHLGRVFNDTASRLQDLYASLQQSEDRLGLVIDTIPAHVWSARPDGSIDFINQRLLEFLGRSMEDILASGWDSLVHPDDVTRVVGEWAAAVATGEPMESEARLRRMDGDYRWLLIRNVPLRDKLGNIASWYGTAIDIEERHLAEDALRRSEGYLANAQRLTRTGSWAWNVATRQSVYWSQENYRLFGFDPEGGIPSDEVFYQRIHPEDRDRVRRETILDRLDEDSQFDVEFRIVLPDGAIKYVRSTGHSVRNISADLLEYVGTSMDVTERERGEQATRLLAAVVESSHDAIVSKDLNGIITSWNKGAERLFGYAAEEAVGQNITLIIPLDRRDEERAIIERLKRGERVDHFETVRMRKDGSLLDVALTISPMKDAAGRIVGASKLARDITERKRSEEALRQAQADLAHLSRVTTMSELTASLAHEIRQPISAAMTNAKTCLRWLGRDDPNLTEGREAAARVIKDVARAADIISRISLLFKKGALEQELVDVNEVIREMIVLLRSEANRYSISIRTDLAENLPKVMADRVQLQQVFMNLMLNGIDAMKEAPGEGELLIKSEASDAQLLISVSDTGVGLPPEQADQIFKAFFTTKDNGTGMGLPISRSIIESHGGRLWATGVPGSGATFQFTLPASAAAHA
jgi:PAS domain S-box-containing protein